jgi:tetratricopeptide (TPR) repeat protein
MFWDEGQNELIFKFSIRQFVRQGGRMPGINAFVAHSFRDEDEELISAFLRYFDQVKKIRQDFSWVHAQSAEPKDLATKVLELVADRNVCIAICTKHQRVLAPEKLSSVFLSPRYSKALTSEISWAASDWIIQEIGLAKGRGMDLIIFLEKGVRQPGGLQGTVEYIEFERESLARPFGKFLEMLQALTPRIPTDATVGSETSGKSAEKETATERKPIAQEPKAGWDESEFHAAMVTAVITGDSEAQSNLDAAYFSSPFGRDGLNIAVWKSQRELMKIYFGKGGSIDVMKKLECENPGSSKLTSLVASAYEDFSDHEMAATKFLEAADKTTDSAEKDQLRSNAAVHFARAKNRIRALAVLERMKVECVGDRTQAKTLLDTTRKVHLELKDDGAEAAALEYALVLAPDNATYRFDVAYKHQNTGSEELALLHYLRIPRSERTAVAWNNLGVSYKRLNMHGLSVAAYEISAGMGETLAMANLAYCFMGAGFLEQAKRQIESALTIENYHENIAESLSRLKLIPGEEEKKKTEALDNAKSKLTFFQEAGGALLDLSVQDGASKWRAKSCDLDVKVCSGELVAKGAYDLEDSALNPYGGGKQTFHYTIEIRGKLSGKLIEAKIKRSSNRPSSSLLNSNGDEAKALLIISADMRQVKVMEHPESSKPSFYEMAVIQVQ